MLKTIFFIQFKAKISPEFENAPVEQLCLIFSGKIMKDHDTLETHNIKDGMTVHLVIRSGNAGANNQQQQSPRPNPEANPSNTSGCLIGSKIKSAAQFSFSVQNKVMI